jgi:hypothetical protein
VNVCASADAAAPTANTTTVASISARAIDFRGASFAGDREPATLSAIANMDSIFIRKIPFVAWSGPGHETLSNAAIGIQNLSRVAERTRNQKQIQLMLTN